MRSWHLIAVLAFILLVETLLVAPDIFNPRRNFTAAVFNSVVIDYANIDRTKAKEPVLRENPLLAQAAAEKALDMATRGYFSHMGPSGETPWSWLDKVGYNYVYAGENLAVNFFDSADVHRAWMNSPAHRENLLDNKFTEIGVGTAPGKFQGRDSLYVVEFFGKTDSSFSLASSTDDSLVKTKRSLLSAVASLPSEIIDLNRHVVLACLSLFGYQPLSGKII